MPDQTVTDRFSALGTTVEGGIRTDPVTGRALFQQLKQAIADFEQRFSRFRDDSELSKVNRAAGWPIRVSDEMLDLLRAARRAWEETDGLIDPTIGRALVSAGYHRSFEHLSKDTDPSGVPFVAPIASFADVRVDEAKKTVTLSPSVTLDPGGIGKGYLLDRLLALLDRAAKDYWLSLGGDLVVSGTDETGEPWPIRVQNPEVRDQDIAKLALLPGRWGVATSGTTKRRGVHRGKPWHHLIDPRTGLPSATDVLAATVVTRTALDADVMAKAVVLLGSSQGIAWASERGIEAVALLGAERRVQTPGMHAMFQRL